MDRHPALMDPRSPRPEPETRSAGRLIPWTFVWLGVLTLGVVAVVAWVLPHKGDLLPVLNVKSPPATNGEEEAGGKDRAVAIAHVDVEKGTTQLYPVRPGRVVEVLVNEGDDVEKDQA